MKLGYSRNISSSMDAAEQAIRAALAEQGFGVLTEIDVGAVLKKKLDVDFGPYKILGACHPASAYKALSEMPEVGLLLPCNVTLRQIDADTIELAAIDAEVMFSIIQHPQLRDLAQDINQRLRAAVDSL